ncbi:complex I NDUFA9 subunit family protein [Gluconacetobacter tumulisoli]|uniref:Complex I NDUFA9 subunit family protein n=1 Tax=Gluconacetobacter tumulisoli TaxID=1286189 RepID=A0A7W4PKA3_9PROT|nr:complex I NDUFA9 subunit family protein [Gluconacetobacter tumulisoli]MBB2201187.1 complex I NDUFA9 subunit family protein [Gluconacetobacter tumulisoli]
MATRKVAAIVGGSGFLGRHVVRRLAEDGYVVRVAARRADRAASLRPLGDVGQIVPLRASILDEESLVPVVEGAHVIVNLVGILAERGRATFQAVHVDGAGRLARLAASAGVERLVHVSAIGASPGSPSAYGRSKEAGEVAVLRSMPEATIVRPSILFGAEDRFTNLFAMLARYSPILPVYGAATRIQPVYVCDVAEGIRRILSSGGHAGEIYEFGGPAVWTMEGIARWVMATTGWRRPVLRVPALLARWQAMWLEHLPGRLLTRDQLAMLSVDNVVTEGARGLGLLGIEALPIELIAPSYLQRYKIT